MHSSHLRHLLDYFRETNSYSTLRETSLKFLSVTSITYVCRSTSSPRHFDTFFFFTLQLRSLCTPLSITTNKFLPFSSPYKHNLPLPGHPSHVSTTHPRLHSYRNSPTPSLRTGEPVESPLLLRHRSPVHYPTHSAPPPGRTYGSKKSLSSYHLVFEALSCRSWSQVAHHLCLRGTCVSLSLRSVTVSQHDAEI